MTRAHLPTRRPNITAECEWRGQAFTVTIGYDPDTATASEVFAGEAKGDMLALICDACIALSIAMQNGETPESLMRSMGRVPMHIIRDGAMAEVMTPASPIGAILAAMMEVEAGT